MTTDAAKSDYTLHYQIWHQRGAAHQDHMNGFYRAAFSVELETIQSQFSNPKSKIEILDFGCGMGLFLNFLRTHEFTSISGFEPDSGQAAVARSSGHHIEQAENPLTWLKACPKKFDVIFAIDVLEHIPPEQLQDVLAAMKAILSDGGLLVATVPNGNSTCAGRWRYIDWTHRLSFTEHSLSHVLKMSGFRIETVLPSEIARFYTSKPSFLKRVSEKAILRVVRAWRRLEFIGEFGWDEGAKIPLTTNIKVRAWKS